MKLKEVLQTKSKARNAILAMNVQSVQQINIVSELSKEIKEDVILQFSAKYISYFEKLFGLRNIVNKYSENENIYFHLDHCDDIKLVKQCLDLGFHSVMFDGSALPLSKNIEETKRVVKMAQNYGALVEGEVGVIGGAEDGFEKGISSYFNIGEALDYYKRTQVDLLALGIGNSHGIYKSTNNVNIELLNKFQQNLTTKALLVLHGATGLKEQQIKDAITYGVVKINYSTAFKIIYQKIIAELYPRRLHDEIYFYEKLRNELRIRIVNILKSLNNVFDS